MPRHHSQPSTGPTWKRECGLIRACERKESTDSLKPILLLQRRGFWLSLLSLSLSLSLYKPSSIPQ